MKKHTGIKAFISSWVCWTLCYLPAQAQSQAQPQAEVPWVTANQITLGVRSLSANQLGLLGTLAEIKYARDLTPQFSLGLGLASNIFVNNLEVLGRYYFMETKDNGHHHRLFSETSLGYNFLAIMVGLQNAMVSQKLGYEYRYYHFIAQASLGGGLNLFTASSGPTGSSTQVFSGVFSDGNISVGFAF